MNHVQWIKSNLDRQKIVFVSQVGDIVDKDNEEQFALAQKCMDVLHGLVPYSITVGNHDMTNDGDSSLFQKYFGANRYREFPWYAGSFEPARPSPAISGNGANSCQLFSAGGMDFVHVSLECNAPDDVLDWANGLLTKYANRRALITTHMGPRRPRASQKRRGIHSRSQGADAVVQDPRETGHYSGADVG